MSIFDIDYINYVWNLLTPPDKRQPNQLAWGSAVMTGKQWKGDTFFDGYMEGSQYLNPSLTLPGNAYNPSATYTTGTRIIYALQAGGAYYGDNAVYEAISINPDGSNNSGFSNKPPVVNNIVPSAPPASALVSPSAALQWLSGYYWIPVQSNFIGANERASYSCSKLIFEYALNKWFGTTFRQPPVGTSDIYITTNSNSNNELYVFSNARNAVFSVAKQDVQYIYSETPATGVADFSIYFPTAIYNALSAETPVSAGTTIIPSNPSLRNSIVRTFADTLNCAGMVYYIVTY